MSVRFRAIAAAALSLATLATSGLAHAADLPVKAVKKAPDLPFFLVIDDRVTFSYIFNAATDPGAWSLKPDGTINSKTTKQVYSFTHFDVWGYGTNFFTISMFKSDHNDPAAPCTQTGGIVSPAAGFAFTAGHLRRRDRNLRTVPLYPRLESAVRHQGVLGWAAAQYLLRSGNGCQHRESLQQRSQA